MLLQIGSVYTVLYRTPVHGNIVNSSTEWTLLDNNIEKVKVEVEDTECNDIDLFVADKFMLWEDAMDTCMKLSRTGMDMSDVTSLEQFKQWHHTGNMNKVEMERNFRIHIDGPISQNR